LVLAAFDWHVITKQVFHPDHALLRALWTTVYISVTAQFFGVLLGLLAALMRMSRLRLFRFLSGLYVLIFRGTPVLVQIVYVYFGANLLFGFNIIPNTLNLGVFSLDGAVVAGIVALSINEGAYMREIIRAGIDAVDKGQTEAAKSLGMTSGQTMRRIVLPQAAKVIVPPLGNEFNNMMKTSSLVAFISVYELFLDANVRYSASYKPEYYIAVAIWYLVLTSVWTLVQTLIERRLAISERGDELSFRDRVVAVWTEGGGISRLGQMIPGRGAR
jgi:polar amino acid transport system permease protein